MCVMFSFTVQLEIIILRSTPNRVVVRSNRVGLYTHQFVENIPPFSGNYYLGGVPENKMPEKWVVQHIIGWIAMTVSADIH